MRINLDKHYAAYAANVEAPYTGMLSVLAAELGVTAESLHALGVGFAPSVAFKQGKTHVAGWWVTPERDAEAKIVGLSLRSWDHQRKVMLPGSKHGLVYTIKPGYATSAPAYTPGRHNWVRTMDVKLPCPVCGKPDGCLLSAEDPSDPKAVMCIREGKGAVKAGDIDTGGWLHIRKTSGEIRNLSPLPASKLPVLVLEGMTDTAAALDLGFEAVGRPSDLAGLAYLRQLLQGREFIIIGENDQKPDGRWPGRTGAERAFESLRHSAKGCWVMPPDGVKDLRGWKNLHGLTQADLLTFVEQWATRESDNRHFSEESPVYLAKRWLRDEHTAEGIPTLRRYGHDWYRYNGTHYESVDETAAIRGGLYRWLDGRMVMVAKKDGAVDLVPYEANMSGVSNIIDALSADCPLLTDPPCWLDGRTSPDPVDLIAFPNGVLNIHGDEPELIPHTAHYFSTSAMPYEYDPEATCPVWERFLAEAFPHNPEHIDLSQEWFGYNLTADTSHHKFMLANGTAGSGKSTWLHGLRVMQGGDQRVATVSLTGLSKEFGLAPLVGKYSYVIGDGSIDKGANAQLLLERWKELTGSSHPILEVRKMRTNPIGLHLFGKITIATNELPDFHDGGSSLQRRTLALPFTQKFDGGSRVPDRTLPDKISQEAAGILNWALRGRARLLKQRNFSNSEETERLVRTFSAASSPVAQFLDTCCDVSATLTAQEDALFSVYRAWARENSISPGARIRFMHNLGLAVPNLKRTVVEAGGQSLSGVVGVGLTQFAKDRYMGA